MRFDAILKALREMTHDCRDNMHEPDEQGLDAEFGPSFRYTGEGPHKVSFDNASCPNPDYKNKWGLEMERMDMGFWLIRNKGEDTEKRLWFNLADIIALARRAQFGDDLGNGQSG